ncbi:hypothetical protein ABIA30_000533 [Mycobacterium sp. MAA66]
MLIRSLAVVLSTLAVGVSSACNAQADPPVFPDLASYTPVSAQDYTVSGPNSGRPEPLTGVYFLTPDGITCGFGSPPSAGCTGNNLPALPAPTPEGMGLLNSIGTNTGVRKSTTPLAVAGAPAFKTLPPLHSLTVDGVVCGVDGSGMTACKDPQGRGFILSPSWSGWLPKV